MPEVVDLDDETLATEEEAKLIEEVRKELAPELDALKAAGVDFPHIVGDIFMLRVLRGNDRDIKMACEWYKKLLECRKKHGMDEIHKKCMDEHIPWRPCAFLNGEEISKYYNSQFDEAERTKDGYFIWYDSVGDVDYEGLKQFGLDKFTEFYLTIIERRASLLDKMSREEGRLVKTIRIMDTDGTGPWRMDKEVYTLMKEKLLPIASTCSVEMVHRLYVLNCGWFTTKIWGILSKLLPERLRRRSRLIGSDYIEDQELLKNVPGHMLEKLQGTRRMGGDDGSAMEGKSRLILAGQIMIKSYVVQKGQKLSWSFAMGSISEAEGRSLAAKLLDKGLGGATDIKFNVSLWMQGDDTTDETTAKEVELLAETTVDAASGEYTGSIEIPSDGTAALRWSNYGGWLRAKCVSHFKITLG
mmetsp:Transcript_77930/g.167222  ORF Transcript_77930/g.167222 Transcript_77930/m.167222 type:complete len:414 (-) Transcript_77930:176-1417(-)